MNQGNMVERLLELEFKIDTQIPLKWRTNIKLEAMTEEKWILISFEKLPDFYA